MIVEKLIEKCIQRRPLLSFIYLLLLCIFISKKDEIKEYADKYSKKKNFSIL